MQQLLKESNLSKGRISTGVTYFDIEKSKNNSLKSPSPCSVMNIVNPDRLSGRSRDVYAHIHREGFQCPACASLELESMREDFAALTFEQAFPRWLEAHTPYISKNTVHYYEQYGAALMPFFGSFKLKNIGRGEVRGFQRWRSHVFEDNDTAELPLFIEGDTRELGLCRLPHEWKTVQTGRNKV